jgi:hypothetical protein
MDYGKRADNELFFNRAEASNYAVLARSEGDKLRLQFIDSDSSEKAMDLTSEQIMNIRVLKTPNDLERTANEILAVSRHKPEDVLIAVQSVPFSNISKGTRPASTSWWAIFVTLVLCV